MATEKGTLDLSVTVGDFAFSAAGETSVVLDAYADFKALIAERKGGTPDADTGDADAADKERKSKANGSGTVKSPTDLPLKPFLEQYELKSNKRKATAIIAWSAERGEKAALTAAEVEKLWKKTPFRAPGNLPRDIRDAESEGWLDSTGKAGSHEATFSINGYGEGILAGWTKKQKE